MTRTTIDYGIDLGTTNSTVGRLDGTGVTVIKNNENQEITPSAVFIDRKGGLVIGREAKNQLTNERNYRDVHVEFKLQMGTDRRFDFRRAGRSLLPEELSAELLKALRADVEQRCGETIETAVITVPAAFDLPQCDATRRAASLAGLRQTPLLQEPVAAAMAYGFQSEIERAFWLVYDLGGGTFDAAVIQVRDGSIQVVNHGGDNHLGGKLIDWEIVEKILIPAAKASAPLADFHRGNKAWEPAILKMKYWAEEIKVKLSRQESIIFFPDNPFNDDDGEPVEFEIEISRGEIARLAEPHVRRSVDIARRVLSDKGLGSDAVEKVLLVGGPTLAPYLRDMLADPREGLGIPLEFGIDSITVVAQGAAVFAGTQRVASAGSAKRAMPSGVFELELEYKPVGPDPNPPVGGRVVAAGGESLVGYTIELINRESKPMWRSGRLPLSNSGTFFTDLWAEKGRANTFAIELFDAEGRRRETSPSSLTYTMGLSITSVPLTHHFGVALADNKAGWIFDKGTPLPAESRRVPLRTTTLVRKGDSSTAIKIPLIEGESDFAIRNRKIGHLIITGDQIKRDLPVDSEVELKLKIDESRLVKATVYISLLDAEFENVLHYDQKEILSAEELEERLEAERERLAEVRARAEDVSDPGVRKAIKQADRGGGDEIDDLVSAAYNDPDASQTAAVRLNEFAEAIDAAERALAWPALAAEADETIRLATEIVEDHGTDKDRRAVATLSSDLREALELGHEKLVRKKIDEIDEIRFRLLREQPGFWVGYLEYLVRQKDYATDIAAFTQWESQARRAIQNEDIAALRNAVRQLAALMPEEQKAQADRAFGSTVRG